MSVTAAELRGQIRDWRRGRADLRWGQVLTEAYIALLAVLVFGSMLVSAVIHAGDTVAACTGEACQGARTVVPVLVLLGWWAAGAALAALLGPLVSSAAASAVVLATPVDRASWLRRQYLLGMLAAGASGGVVAALVTLLGGWPATTAAAFTAAAAVLGPVGYAAGVLAQPEPRSRARHGGLLRAIPTTLPVVSLVLGLVAVAVGGVAGLTPPAASGWWLLPAGGLLVAVPLVLRAGRRLGGLRRRELIRGHGLARGLAGALSGLDPALAFDVILQQSAARRPRVRARRGPTGLTGPAALIGADLNRLRRRPLRMAVLLAALPVPYAAAAAGGVTLVLPVAIVSGFLAAVPLGAGVRVLARTPAMSRLLGHHPGGLRAAALTVPGVLILLFGLATTPALPGDQPVLGLAVGMAGWAALARWLMAAPPDYSRPLVSTPMGAVPTNLYGSAIRGFDIAALASMPVLFLDDARGAALSIVVSAITLGVLIGRR